MTDLLPCPFCGEQPKAQVRDGVAMIQCFGHDCLGPRTTAGYLDDAKLQWNKRTFNDAQLPVPKTTEISTQLRSICGQQCRCAKGDFRGRDDACENKTARATVAVLSTVHTGTAAQPQQEQLRSSGPAEKASSGTWTAGIDALRSYPYQDTQWHLHAIEFHHKVREEAEAIRDRWLAAQPPAAPVETAANSSDGGGESRPASNDPQASASRRPQGLIGVAGVASGPSDARSSAETVIGPDGKSRPITLRQIIARAALGAIEKPDGVETLDWQIADAVIAVLPGGSQWVPASAASVHIPAPAGPSVEPQPTPDSVGPKTCLDNTGLRITSALYKAVNELNNVSPCLLAMIGSWGDTLDDADVLDGLNRYNEMGECFVPDVVADTSPLPRPQSEGK